MKNIENYILLLFKDEQKQIIYIIVECVLKQCWKSQGRKCLSVFKELTKMHNGWKTVIKKQNNMGDQ